MKKRISLLLILVLISSIGFAQKGKKPQVSVDSITHLISYEEVVSMPNLSADLIYNRALAWFRKYYKNSGDVIRENDITNHVISGKPRFKVYNPPDKDGTKTDAD